MAQLLVISYDAVGDSRYESLLAYPNFRRLAARSAAVRKVDSVFLTNTYPVHASVSTGVEPARHGLINNTDPFPARNPAWHSDAALLKATTLWQAARQRGLSVAAVMWPVTGNAREIRWNIPEVLARPGKSQILTSLAAGSKWLQLKELIRHFKKIIGIRQPARDRFAAHCMADILREKRPDLALMHFTAFDSLCHQHGVDSPKLEEALAALDEGLGLLLEAADQDATVLVFSDHSQLPAANHVEPNRILVDMGLLAADEAGDYLPGPAFVECCGGAAFLHPGPMTDGQVVEFLERVEKLAGFGRFLTREELRTCGRGDLPLGFSARPGFAMMAHPGYEKANHGYPVDEADYRVFYQIKGEAFPPGRVLEGGSLLDIAPLAAAELGIAWPGLPAPRRDLYR